MTSTFAKKKKCNTESMVCARIFSVPVVQGRYDPSNQTLKVNRLSHFEPNEISKLFSKAVPRRMYYSNLTLLQTN